MCGGRRCTALVQGCGGAWLASSCDEPLHRDPTRRKQTWENAPSEASFRTADGRSIIYNMPKIATNYDFPKEGCWAIRRLGKMIKELGCLWCKPSSMPNLKQTSDTYHESL